VAAEPTGAGAGEERVRTAWYALESGGWRDYVTLLHPPYTLWHLSYVCVGAALAPTLSWARLGAALAAFALAMGIGAHALDELHGRPLRTRISDRTLWSLAGVSLASAAAIGVYASVAWTAWLAPFVAVGVFLTVAYNLELFGGAFHSDLWFGLTWGAFPLLATYVVEAETVRWETLAAALWAALLSLTQRALSKPVREARRHEARVASDLETALRLLNAATVVLAVALLVLRL
jgi:hypothetical protein